jgi:DNA-binding MarR family transcriptional regulator
VYILLIMRRKTNRLNTARCGRVAAYCTCFNLRKAARSVTGLFEGIMRSTGLRSTQFSLLIATSLADSVTVTRLADMLGIDRTTLTRDLKPLEKRGMVKTVPGRDQRTRIITLTERGHETLAKAFPLWEKAQSRMVKGLGQKRWQNFSADLAAVAAMAREV